MSTHRLNKTCDLLLTESLQSSWALSIERCLTWARAHAEAPFTRDTSERPVLASASVSWQCLYAQRLHSFARAIRREGISDLGLARSLLSHVRLIGASIIFRNTRCNPSKGTIGTVNDGILRRRSCRRNCRCNRSRGWCRCCLSCRFICWIMPKKCWLACRHRCWRSCWLRCRHSRRWCCWCWQRCRRSCWQSCRRICWQSCGRCGRQE